MMNTDDLNFNIETVNLDSELEFETLSGRSGVDSQPLNISKHLDGLEEFEPGEIIGGELPLSGKKGRSGQEDEDFVSRMLGWFNPINWDVLKGHFDVTTEEIKQRMTKILKITYSKEGILENIAALSTGLRSSSMRGGFSGFPQKVQKEQLDGPYELFFCKNLDQNRRCDLYGPFWLNVTLAYDVSLQLPFRKWRQAPLPPYTHLLRGSPNPPSSDTPQATVLLVHSSLLCSTTPIPRSSSEKLEQIGGLSPAKVRQIGEKRISL
ncbi:Yip1 domain-containing protein [Cryptosporidium felis]|nr:Yip1 domain-containing protein [Cryptosporidium felis]